MDRAAAPTRAGLLVRREPAADDGPSWVVAQAEEELLTRYGALDQSELGLEPQMFEPPAGAFFVARAQNRVHPVGGVGVRRLHAGTGEVKRLWVDPAWRGRGTGRSLMAALEDGARRLGLCALVLGTGERQPEAVSLYASSGWERLLVDPEGRPLPDWHLRFAKRLV